MRNSSLGFSSQLSAVKVGPPDVKGYHRKNFWHRLRSPKAEIYNALKIGSIGEIRAKIIRGGKEYDLGVISRRVVTNAGVAYLANAFAQISSSLASNFNFHDCGTGTNSENVTDTALQTPYGGSRATGTQTSPSAGVYRSVGTINFTSTLAITEWGLFSASSAGTLWDRAVFSALNVVNGDSIIFTYNLTINAGG